MPEIHARKVIELSAPITGEALIAAVKMAAGKMFRQIPANEGAGLLIGQDGATRDHVRVGGSNFDAILPGEMYPVVVLQVQQWPGMYTLEGYTQQAYEHAIEEFAQKLKTALASVVAQSPKPVATIDAALVLQMLQNGRLEELEKFVKDLLGKTE